MLSLVQAKHIPRGHIFPLSCLELILYETNSQMYTGLSIHKCLGKLLAPLAVSLFRHTEVKKKKKKWLSTVVILIIQLSHVMLGTKAVEKCINELKFAYSYSLSTYSSG